ncbi:Signal transduction histidine kinase [Paraburkholderia phenazinium]|uniref:histidine kinase n=1 Tax=Paraburkholderia phenazinium TaxID=60549 RepID=A0A1N6KCH4_9BURK|nr:Signal transduction histidine kinase [Paraburkholderia phenazinium]
MKHYRILTLPRTLFMRLTLVMIAGVIAAQGLALWLTIDLPAPHESALVGRLPLVLLAQLTLLAGCCWIAVRVATRPLNELANAANTLGPDLSLQRLPEDGPVEIAGAARAFNAMQERIGACLKERIQILAAISHDLQTPITRMRIRADMMDNTSEREKMQDDLKQMESLVREGVAYARTLHGTAETAMRIDPDAFLESLVGEYIDAGGAVRLVGRIGTPILARPHALRRVLANLVDNAIKFSGSAEVRVDSMTGQQVSITVLDRGPGIPAHQLDAVFQPFYRVESSRNRQTGGTGLGLAIAKQLAESMNASLVLRNRDGGGIEARLALKGAV